MKKTLKTCIQCGKTDYFRGEKFCSHSCAMTYSNYRSNPSRRPDVRAKISEQAKVANRQAQLMTPDAREKARKGMSRALSGRKQDETVVARRVDGWKRTAAKHGGMTPAHRQQLERVQKEYSGEKHHNWNGGTTTERRKDYRSESYKDYRQSVLDRDDYTCQDCGKRGGRLEVHHRWIPYAQCQGDLAFLKYHPENGVTLCRSCHNKTKTCQRPDLQKPALSQLPQHILELIWRQVGADF